MSPAKKMDVFDPYHRWLGIPPQEQPPHHYRLLGLTLFETSAEVIASASDRQMTHVKMFQRGVHARQSQSLLNEISAAAGCLLNPESKASYDRQLRDQLVADTAAKPAAPVASPPLLMSGPPVASSSRRRNSKLPAALLPAQNVQRQWMLIQLAIVGVVAVMGVGVLWFAFFSHRGTQPVAVAASPAPRRALGPSQQLPRATEDASETPPQEAFSPSPTIPPPAPVGVAPPAPPPSVSPDSALASPSPGGGQGTEEAHVAPQANSPAVEHVVETPPSPAASPSPAVTDHRWPVPDAEAQRATGEQLRDAFRAELAAATTPDSKSALGTLLLEQSRRTGDEPTAKYVLIQAARGLAMEAGDPVLALRAASELADNFAVESLEVKAATLSQVAAAAARTPAANKALAEASLAFADEAAAQERFDLAQAALNQGLTAARRLSERDLLRELVEREKEIDAQRREHEVIVQARQTLLAQPNDVAANLLLGKHLCLEVGDWTQGLGHLARLNVPAIASLAADDLNQPTSVEQRIALADRWWEFTDPAQDNPWAEFRLRARYWYQLALPEVSGLTRIRIEKRLSESNLIAGNGPAPLVCPVAIGAAREKQVEWSQWLKTSVVRSNSIGMKLALIPHGEFTMGSPNTEPGRDVDELAHKVQISRPVFMGIHEVTVGEFTAFVNATGYKTQWEVNPGGQSPPDKDQEKIPKEMEKELERMAKDMEKGFPGKGPPAFKGKGKGPPIKVTLPLVARNWRSPPFPQSANSPVVYVTWDDAQAFCQWMSKKEGQVYRLPTEAEWEFACRGGSDTAYSFGDQEKGLDQYAWCQMNSPQGPHFVGLKRANPWGLFDMHGNAWEWCADWYAPYDSNLAMDPQGPNNGQGRVVRGGGWASAAPRAALRASLSADRANEGLGFRVVLEISSRPSR